MFDKLKNTVDARREVLAEAAKTKAEAARTKAEAAEDGFKWLFLEQANSEKWEYCHLHHITRGVLMPDIVYLHYRSITGEAVVREIPTEPLRGEQKMLEVANHLGSVGWEICGITRSSVATGSREKMLLEKGLSDFGRDATVATGLSTTTNFFLKRRLPPKVNNGRD